mmetsp:Transcript_7898/g.18316  ORF Transcript_7898/g.18316 Transcript_7898/m.18316 type:complete len:467 (+) Transcript_7898:2353-3753(+)
MLEESVDHCLNIVRQGVVVVDSLLCRHVGLQLRVGKDELNFQELAVQRADSTGGIHLVRPPLQALIKVRAWSYRRRDHTNLEDVRVRAVWRTSQTLCPGRRGEQDAGRCLVFGQHGRLVLVRQHLDNGRVVSHILVELIKPHSSVHGLFLEVADHEPNLLVQVDITRAFQAGVVQRSVIAPSNLAHGTLKDDARRGAAGKQVVRVRTCGVLELAPELRSRPDGGEVVEVLGVMPLGRCENVVAVRPSLLIPRELAQPRTCGGRNEDDAGDKVEPLIDNGLLQSQAIIQPRATHQHVRSRCLQCPNSRQQGCFVASTFCELKDFRIIHFEAHLPGANDRLTAGEVREGVACVAEEGELPVREAVRKRLDMLEDAGGVVRGRNHDPKLVSPTRHPNVHQAVLRWGSAAAMEQRLLDVVLSHSFVNRHVELLEGVHEGVDVRGDAIVKVQNTLGSVRACPTYSGGLHED